jgi:phthalate 4,5-cis-dihydrodiol dehydrogenase
MIGIGVGGAGILPAMEAINTVDLVAGADVIPQTLERFKQRFPNARTYESAEALCRDPDVAAVWVSSPNRFHAEHAILAASHGKHVVVEKPMAISMDRAQAMVEAAENNSVQLLAGHTMSFSAPIRAMRKIIQSGRLGRLCALNVWAYTDWLLRPRTAASWTWHRVGVSHFARRRTRWTRCGCPGGGVRHYLGAGAGSDPAGQADRCRRSCPP